MTQWSRRDLLMRGSLAAFAAALGSRRRLGQGAPPAAGAAAPAAAPVEAQFADLRNGVGICAARGGTIGWYLGANGAAVVDSQTKETAPLCIAGLRARSARPIDVLINTHHHADHTGGNGVFKPAVKHIVAQANVPALQLKAAAEQKAGEQTVADQTFADTWRLDLGGETVAAAFRGPAHTGGDAVVHFEKADIVHAGDLVFNRLYPFIDRKGGGRIRGWITALERIVQDHDDGTIYVFGHGRKEFGVTGRKADLLVQRDFFTALLDTAQKGLAAGKSADEIAKAEALPGFADHVSPVPFLSLANCLKVAVAELSGG